MIGRPRRCGGVRLPLVSAILFLIIAALLSSTKTARQGGSVLAAAGDGRMAGHRDPDAGVGGGPGTSAGAFNLFQRAYPHKAIPTDGYQRGLMQADSMRQLQTTVNTWKSLGPFNAQSANFPDPISHASTSVSGRVSAIAVDPSTCGGNACGTIYIGAAGGGVWKTTDGGQSWNPLLDDQPDLAVGSIVLDPQNPNIVYVGTGEPSHANGSRMGMGILRSTDGGQTWTTLGQAVFQGRAVTSIVIDPRTAGGTDPTLYASTTAAEAGAAATGGDDFYTSPNLPPRGVYVSTDGGQNWSLTSGVFDGNQTVSSESVVGDPSNPDTLYAGFDGRGVYKSTDRAHTWQASNNGLPTKDFQFVKVAISPSDPQVLYVAIDLEGGSTTGLALYRSDDAAQHWSELPNTPNACADQCFANLVLSIDPSNPAVVYVGGTANYGYLFGQDPSCRTFSPLAAACNATLIKSTDGGNSWTDIAENGGHGPLHPDAHAILVDPTNPNVVYIGCDGGLFHTANGGLGWDSLNKGLNTLEVDSISVNSASDLFIGTQDNGSFVFTHNSDQWQHVLGGDGGVSMADPHDESRTYNTKYGATFYRSELSHGSWQNVDISAFRSDFFHQNRGNFYEPYALAPSRPNDIFYGTYRVWRSKIRGGVDGNHDGLAWNDRKDKNDWVPISFDLSCDRRPSKPATSCDSQSNSGAGIAAVAVSPVNPNIVVAATSNGHIWLTTNALAKVKTDAHCEPWRHRDFFARCNFVRGVRWARIDSGLPNRFPTSVRFASGSSTVMFVTYSGFDGDTPGAAGHLFVTTDLGRNWTNLNGIDANRSLPDLPFLDVLLNTTNGHLYAAADYGLYVSKDNGKTWDRFDTGLPAAPVFQMQYFALGGELVVGTYGRGVWEVIAP